MSALAAWRLTPEERDFAASVAGIAEELRPAAGALEAGAIGARPLLETLAPYELAGAAVPEALGGAGAAPRTALVAVAGLACVSPPVALLVARAQGAAWALATAGPAPPADCLEALIAGEPAALANAPAVSWSPDGGGARLRGEVVVDGACWAGTLLLLAGGEGMLVRPLPDGMPRAARARTGLRGLGTETLALDAAAVRLPAGVVRRALAYAAVADAVAATAVAATALDEAAAHVEERHQFGGPLARLPIVQNLLAGARERLARAEARLLALAAADPDAWTAGAPPLRDAARTAVDACDVALQLHGGYGYVDELPAERRLRDALSLRALAA